MKNVRIYVLVIAAATLLVLAGFWLFRERPFLSSMGEATAVWRWGMCRELRVDGNADGKADVLGVFEWGWRTPDADTPFVELRESLECDGVYDVRVEYHKDGGLAILNVDTNRDGEFDKALTGAEGMKHLEKLRLNSSCLDWN